MCVYFISSVMSFKLAEVSTEVSNLIYFGNLGNNYRKSCRSILHLTLQLYHKVHQTEPATYLHSFRYTLIFFLKIGVVQEENLVVVLHTKKKQKRESHAV